MTTEEPKKEHVSNVIPFPKINPIRIRQVETLSKEQIDTHFLMTKMYIIDEAMGIVMPQLYNNLSTLGYPITPHLMKEGALVSEAVRSLLLKIYGIEHSFQKLADMTFTTNEENDLTLSDKSNIMANSTSSAVSNN